MLSRLLAFFLLLALGFSQKTRSLSARHVDDEWTEFKEVFDKKYASEEDEAKHRAIFSKRWQFIQEHNKRYQQGEETFEAGYNIRTDLPDEAYGFTPVKGVLKRGHREGLKNLTWTPDSCDWRKHGFVSNIKDQGTNCSWSFFFAAVASIEGTMSVNSEALNLSEQQLIDCLLIPCNLSSLFKPHIAMDYMMAYGQQNLESADTYPYTGVKGQCKFNPNNTVVTLDGSRLLWDLSENDLKFVVFHLGIAAVSVDANHESFRVYYEPACNSSNLNHNMAVVGYGTNAEQGDYWILKNSWGTSWGESGYMRMARNRGDKCGITSTATVAKIVFPPPSKPTETFF